MKNIGSDDRIRLNVTYTCEEEEGGFASHCRELGVSSCGDTREEALENIHEAVQVHLATLADYGELGRYLEERGVDVSPAADLGATEWLVPVDKDGGLECPEPLEPSGSMVLWDARHGEARSQAQDGVRATQYSFVL